ncbi:MAG: tetratricopeptide repeat protein [Myxococcaceae bacterium]
MRTLFLILSVVSAAKPLPRLEPAAAARAKLQRGCEGGNANACYALGVAQSRGLGGLVEEINAEQSWMKACEHGQPRACDALATQTKRRDGNYEERAREGYAQSCERADAHACFRLGQLLRGTQPEAARTQLLRAAPLLKRRCGASDGEACALLSVDLREGLSVAPNLPTAMKLLRRACDLGQVTSCEELASRYASGAWRDMDTKRAKALYARACRLGSRPACAEEEALAKKPVSAASVVRAKCAVGEVPDEDAPSRCCWPGQIWSSADARCVGAPACPSGRIAEGEHCACGDGRSLTPEGACCWPGQRWSGTACIGVAVRCPQTHQLRDGSCTPYSACEGGRVATQQTQGACCWPGQSWRKGECSGKPSSCAAQWTLSGDACVPGPQLAWPYATSAVAQATYAAVPDEATLQHKASTLRLASSPGCTARLIEETTEESPKFEGGHLRIVRETTIPLRGVTSISVSEVPGRNGSELFLSVSAPGIVQKTASHRDTDDPSMTTQNSKDESGVDSWGRFVSFPGGAAESAKGLAAAAKGCGANPEINPGPGGSLEEEQRELSRRLLLQANARAEGSRLLAQEGRIPLAAPRPNVPEPLAASVTAAELARLEASISRGAPREMGIASASSVGRQSQPLSRSLSSEPAPASSRATGDWMTSSINSGVGGSPPLSSCHARSGETCWYAPVGRSCPAYPSNDACSREHGRCAPQRARTAPSC